MKKFILSLALLCACTSSPQHHENTLRLCLDINPSTLDPRICGTLREQLLTKALFEGLVRIDPTGEPTLALADSVVISDDRLTYTFQLKESFWSDGTPVTAHDFESSWKSVLSPDFPSRHSYYLYPLKNATAAHKGELSTDEVGVTALDDHTLVVQLEHPAPYFLELLANPFYSPVPKDGDLTNGPFRLVEWKHDRSLSLEKNPYYWDAETVELDGVEIAIVQDGMTAFELYRKGKCDWAGSPFFQLPSEIVAELRKRGELETMPVNGEFHYTFDVDQVPFNSKKVRQALAYAINRAAMMQVLRSGEVPSTSLLPANLTLHNFPLFPDGNSDRALQLFEEGLQELGMKREELPPIVVGYCTNGSHKRIAQIIQQQWQETFGITVQIEGRDPGGYLRSVFDTDFPVAGLSWFSIYNDPSYNLEVFRDRNHSMNSTHWEHPEFTRLLTDAKQEVDSEKRRELYKAAEALIIDEMPAVPLFTSAFTYATPTRVEGIYIKETGYNTDLKWAHIK